MIHGKCSALSASFFQNKISVIYEITKQNVSFPVIATMP